MSSSPGERTRRVAERYRVAAVLGEGGMGVVYDAHDDHRGHRVALKTLKQPSPEAIYRLKREFRALADLSHPNVVQLYDLVVDGHGVSYSMEVVEGADFVAHCRGRDRERTPVADSISMETTLPGREEAFALESTDLDKQPVLAIDELRLRTALGQLVAGLRALHEAGLVHRDVKPSNVLVHRGGRLVLLDFGLAANRMSFEKESIQGLIGTVAYMSPEQAEESTDTGPATDWYAVGVMLYEVLAGRLPFAGTFVQMLLAKRSDPPRPSTLVKGIPPDLDDLCVRLLATAPEARPTGAEIGALLGIAEPEPGTGRIDLTTAPRFTGRIDELAALDRAVEVVRSGRPALAWVRGPSGIGKSTLINEFLARVQARHDDAVILRGRCYEQELVPFKAVDGLIDGLSRVWRRLPGPDAAAILPRAGGALQRLFPVLARVAALAEAPSAPESRDPLEMRTRAFGALREVLQRLADRRLVVMFLDDLQWVDADTLHLLIEVMRPPDAPRILLLVSSRSEAQARGLEEATARMDVETTHVELGPLAASEARALVAALLGGGAGEVADRVVREAAGSPFFLGELVRYLQTVGPNAASAAINIGDVVRRRISLLPASARLLLELVAIGGEPLRLRELAAATDSDAEQVARDVRVLRVDHLVRAPGGRGDERVEPYHDRIRAAILDALEPETRRRHHRALAVALGGEASPSRLARHWAGAGDRIRAATHARRAADRATATFDFESACELYRMALDLGEHDDAARRELQVLLGASLLNAGRCAEAAELFLTAADGPDPMQRLDLRRRAAEHFLNAGVIERGVETLRAVLAEIGEDLPASSAIALRTFIWNYLRLRVSSLRWKARDASQIPPRELFRLDCYISIGLSLGMVDPIVGGVYQVKGLLVALRLGEPTRLFKIAALHGIFLLAQGSTKRGLTVISRCEEIAEASKDPFHLAWIAVLRGFADYFTANYERAEIHLLDAQRRFHEETTGAAAELNHSRVFLCQVLRYQGRFGSLRERFDEYVRDARQRGDQYLKTTLHRAFAVRFLAVDDVPAAREALAASWWSPPEKGFHLQHWYGLRAGVEILLYTGELDVAEVRQQMDALVASRMLRVQTVRAEAASLRLRLALAGVPGWNPKKEIAALRREGAVYATVWAGLGSAALAIGDARVRHLRETAKLADAHGMFGCAHAARWRLGESLGGAEGDALIAAARTGLAELGVARPERMLEVIAPALRPPDRR